MNMNELTSLKCAFIECDAFANASGVSEAVELLKRHEGQFIDANTRGPHPDPVAVAREDPEGILFGALGLSLRHPGLQPDLKDYLHADRDGFDPLSRPGAGELDYIPNERWVTLRQNIDFPDPVQPKAEKIERVGIGLLQFFYHFLPILKPAYAYVQATVDAESDPSPGSEFRETGKVSYLCWANYFGPDLVAKAGEAFFRTAPVWRSVRMPTGGFLCVVTESFLNWHFGKHLHHVRYFRKAFPGIEEL